jgi:hypothetical protein
MTLETRNTGAEIVESVAKARASFRGGRTRDVSWRRAQLEALKRLLKNEESAIFEALWADLRKPRLEGYLTEVGFVVEEIDDTLRHLDGWMKPGYTAQSILGRLHVRTILGGGYKGGTTYRADCLSPRATWFGGMSGYPRHVGCRFECGPVPDIRRHALIVRPAVARGGRDNQLKWSAPPRATRPLSRRGGVP